MSTSAVLGSSPGSSRDLSPVDSSPFSERPIRPLPKRRLRERLSPDIADSIEYPPAPKLVRPLFYQSYQAIEEARAGEHAARGPGRFLEERERADDAERNYIARRNGGTTIAVDQEDRHLASQAPVTSSGSSYRYSQASNGRYHDALPPLSAASSVEEYDSFENTNNKKKRKIPTSGDTMLGNGMLTGDMASLGLSAEETSPVTHVPGAFHEVSSSNTGIHGFSGPGRGRYARLRNGRSPLRALSDASSSNLGNSRLGKQRQGHWPLQPSAGDSLGYKEAPEAVRIPVTPSRGQENSALVQADAAAKISPASTQFTFTCDSQVPAPVPWPTSMTEATQHAAKKGMANQGTQTGGPLSTGQAGNVNSKSAPPRNTKGAPPPASTVPPPASKPRRRTAAKEYALAARDRRQQQQYQNYHHPPAAEDVWICEFCEYERIFGSPPEALIRQYEIKDRRVRKQEAVRRRLLEKAKTRGRKGRKPAPASNTKAGTTDRQASTGQQSTVASPTDAVGQEGVDLRPSGDGDPARNHPVESSQAVAVERPYEYDELQTTCGSMEAPRSAPIKNAPLHKPPLAV